jgi:membrane protein YdbS with pleckstrin-like domain
MRCAAAKIGGHVADQVQKASAWIYSGLWSALTGVFLVPREPPGMPAGSHRVIDTFRLSPGWLRYTKLYFWIGLSAIDVVFTLLWIGLMVTVPIVGIVLALPVLAIIVLPDVFAYIAIHLRYDTTWYVLTDRSMRLRCGVLHLTETTITYENVQNVTVEQGPVQRFFGIADVVVHTAGGSGGGGGGKHGHGGGGGGFGHLGRIEGVENAQEIREHIMARVRESRSAGLGDEHRGDGHGSGAAGGAGGAGWSAEHVRALREIRDLLVVAPGSKQK